MKTRGLLDAVIAFVTKRNAELLHLENQAAALAAQLSLADASYYTLKEEAAGLVRERDKAMREAAELRRVLKTAGDDLCIDVDIPQDLITHIDLLRGDRDSALEELTTVTFDLAEARDQLGQAVAELELVIDERDALLGERL